MGGGEVGSMVVAMWNLEDEGLSKLGNVVEIGRRERRQIGGVERSTEGSR